MVNFESVKKAFRSKLSKLVCSSVAIMALAAPAVFAEGSAQETDAIATAMNTAVQGTVSTAYTMFIGLIPVGLQIMSAFIIFKLGKKFFGKVAS